MSHGGERMVSALLAEACVDPAADLAEFRSRYLDIVTPTTALFDGVADGLQRLHGHGYQLAICSNKPQNLCEQVLVDTDIDQLFAVVVGGTQGVPPKPAPDLLDRTLDALSLSAGDCVYVGDSELDHAVAAHCDMPFHFMTYGYASPDWSPANCHVHDHFPSLLTQLLPEQMNLKLVV
jgi:phosphoglycolate phosphatase